MLAPPPPDAAEVAQFSPIALPGRELGASGSERWRWTRLRPLSAGQFEPQLLKPPSDEPVVRTPTPTTGESTALTGLTGLMTCVLLCSLITRIACITNENALHLRIAVAPRHLRKRSLRRPPPRRRWRCRTSSLRREFWCVRSGPFPICTRGLCITQYIIQTVYSVEIKCNCFRCVRCLRSRQFGPRFGPTTPSRQQLRPN